MVDFPAPEGLPGRDCARFGRETYVVQDFLTRLVREAHALHFHEAFRALEQDGTPRCFIFRIFLQNFSCALQPVMASVICVPIATI